MLLHHSDETTDSTLSTYAHTTHQATLGRVAKYNFTFWEFSGVASLHREFNTPALRLAVITPRDPVFPFLTHSLSLSFGGQLNFHSRVDQTREPHWQADSCWHGRVRPNFRQKCRCAGCLS